MYVIRCNEEVIHKGFANEFIIAILGARRVGKTSLVYHYAKQNSNKKWVFLNMDSISERNRVLQEGLEKIIITSAEQKIGGTQKIWVSIDEAQKCPEIFEQIKIIYDKFKDKNKIKFILTGSGFLALHRLSAESLAGRIFLYHLREFNLRESASFNIDKSLVSHSLFDIIFSSLDIDALSSYVTELYPFRQKLVHCLEQQLIWGGFPKLFYLTNHEQLKYLDSYLQTYLEKDIRSLLTISDLNLYQNVMKITAEQTGSVCSDQRILHALGCNLNTLKKYRGYLVATLLYREIYPYIGSSLKRIIKSPKGYLVSNGLITYLTGINDANLLKKSGMIGNRFENWFLRELQVALDRDVRKSDIYYWRTSGGAEVDFIVEIKPAVYPFEVTYSDQIQKNKLRNLKRFMSQEIKVKMGFYVYMGDFKYDVEHNICFLPAWLLG